ncbi:hypothetical protein KC799_25335 [candidate division KSB1 bacterium]|nr:hypothetical protein [candidate division KSB1 bacterium]
MSGKLSKIMAVLLGIILVVGFVFKERITGSVAVYHHITTIHQALENGQDKLALNASIVQQKKENKKNSIDFTVRYEENSAFEGEIHFNKNQFLIHSDKQKTTVQRLQSPLSISGDGPDFINFDIARFLGEVIEEHPKLNQIMQLSWIDRTGIAFWSMLNCSFGEENIDGKQFKSISFPPDKKTGVILAVKYITGDKYQIQYGDQLQAELDFHPEEKPLFAAMSNDDTKSLNVDRGELNRSIYQGALRAAGILLDQNMPVPLKSGTTSVENGKLIIRDNKRILIAKGSHRQIGEVHGRLLQKEIQKLVEATLYTMGWVYTLEKGQWFLNEMRNAYSRLQPFIPQKYQEELNGLSSTSGVSLQELQLANVFPALFHCSGFAVFNQASKDGVLYHGRVLDYITELGLQNVAVVFILQPEGSNGFTNVGYAGFIGSVSGMNDQQVAFGEMGGRGEGDWDGMPMPILMREGLETTKTLEDAVELFRNTPRTCEYFYVLSDGKIPDAVGLSTTPDRFITIKPNQFHPQLPHPMQDAVLMSADKRYEKLAERVKDNYGQIGQEEAIHLMDRPVAMKSNLHNVLFAPQSLEFWVADAGINTPACNEPYVHFSLKELLEEPGIKESDTLLSKAE